MRMNKTLVCLYLILALLLQPAAYGGNGDKGPAPAALTEKVSEDDGPGTTLATMSGGCLGGALIGTVVPFFGNVAGCVLGGIAGWWFGRDKQAVAAGRQRQPVL